VHKQPALNGHNARYCQTNGAALWMSDYLLPLQLLAASSIALMIMLLWVH
jgi:hypothetical protein